MYLKKKRNIIFLIVFFHTMSCQSDKSITTSTLSRKIPRHTIKSARTYTFMLQPYEQARIALNNIKIRPRILYHDKNLAKISLPVPRVIKDNRATLSITRKGYQPFSRTIDIAPGRESSSSGLPPLFVLDPQQSRHSFHAAFRTGRQPKSVRFINNTTLVVPLLNDNGIDIINIKNRNVRRIQPSANFAKHKGFVESIILKNEDEIWISQMSTNSAHVFSLDDFDHKKTISTSGTWCKILLENPSNNTVFIANWESQDISVIDKDSYREISHFDAGGVPRGLCISPSGKFLYVCQYGHWNDVDANGQILKIELKSMNTIKSFGQPGAKRHIVRHNKRGLFFVSDMAHARIEVYATRDDRLIKNINVYSHPNTIKLTPDSRYLYVSCRGKNNPRSYLLKGATMGRIYTIDTETLQVVEYWEGGNQCTGLDVSPDGNYVAFSDFLDNTVRVYRRK